MKDNIPISVDINEAPATFCVMQHDHNSRSIVMSLTDCDNPDEKKINLAAHNARLFCLLPDGETSVKLDGRIIDEENGVVEFLLTSAVTAQEGSVQAQAIVASGAQVLSLRRFTFGVLPNFVDKKTIDDWLAER